MDTQFLPGYCLLLASPQANHLSDLPFARRSEFLLDMSLLGQAIEIVCRPQGLRRMNYEILGNTDTHLHAHIFPRYEWELAEYRGWPVWLYPKSNWTESDYQRADEKHSELKQQIAVQLHKLMGQAGASVS